MNFIPELSVLVPYVLGVIVITITPGPDMTFFLARTISQGAAAGISAMSGAVLGTLIHSMLVAFGLSALIIASPSLFLMIKILGAGYLMWLAIDAIRNGSTISATDRPLKQRSQHQIMAQGLVINLMNPKIILFFMTFLPQFVSPLDPYAPGKLLFLGFLFSVIAIPMILPMIFAAGRLTSFLKRSPKVTRLVDYIFATVFGAFAVRILLTERG
ncbi:MAG: LysE family translocator [Rhizobiaceae bacterium]